MEALSCDVRLATADVRDFLAPRHVLNGDGASRHLGQALTAWGMAPGRALVVCDSFLAKSGLIDMVLGGLSGAGWTLEIFSDVTGEPTIADAEQLVERARSFDPSLVVGVGGGSAMDLAKVAALLVTNDGPVEAHVGVDLSERPPVALALVPTTTGTGAETTRIAMLADASGKRIVSNRLLMPLVAVLDVELVMGLPAPVTSSTGMDALAHATESFLSRSGTVLSTTMSLRAVELLREWLPIAFEQPDNKKARRATLYGAFLAGLGLNAGVVLGHSMAYTVANRAHVPHGVTCAMALPFCLAYNASGNIEGSDHLANRLTGGRYGDLRSAADWLLELNDILRLPTSPLVVGIPQSEIDPMAIECAEKYPRPTNPVAMTPESLKPLYRAWFARDLESASAF